MQGKAGTFGRGAIFIFFLLYFFNKHQLQGCLSDAWQITFRGPQTQQSFQSWIKMDSTSHLCIIHYHYSPAPVTPPCVLNSRAKMKWWRGEVGELTVVKWHYISPLMFNQPCHWAHTRLSQTTPFQYWGPVCSLTLVYVTGLEVNNLPEMS